MKMSNKFKDKMKSVGLIGFLRKIFYRMDWRKPSSENVNNFLKNEIAWCRKNKHKLPRFISKNNDDLIIEITNWVRENITYKPDIERFKVVEVWQTCMATMQFRTGDCEDGAILIYCLAIINGVPITQLFLTTGWIKQNFERKGHCYIKYLPDNRFHTHSIMWDWEIKDWCFQGEYGIEWWTVSAL